MQHADAVYLNGLLYTGDAQRRFAQALATKEGKIDPACSARLRTRFKVVLYTSNVI